MRGSTVVELPGAAALLASGGSPGERPQGHGVVMGAYEGVPRFVWHPARRRRQPTMHETSRLSAVSSYSIVKRRVLAASVYGCESVTATANADVGLDAPSSLSRAAMLASLWTSVLDRLLGVGRHAVVLDRVGEPPHP